MKKLLLILLFTGLFASVPVQAKLSCSELDELAEILDDLAVDLQSLESFGVNSEVDVALKELTDALQMVANEEQDKRLGTWIQGLEIAWEDMEREDFEESLDDIIERLDDLYDKDCTRTRY